MSRWRIQFVDGSEELTPEDTDTLVLGDRNSATLVASGAKKYTGGTETKATYVVANIRKWVPVR